MTTSISKRPGQARSGRTTTPLVPSLAFTAIDPDYAKVLRVSCLLIQTPVVMLGAGLGLWFERVWLWIAVAMAAAAVVTCLSLATRKARAYGYFEGEDELLVCRGLMWRSLYAIPYGRMQQVVVEAGPITRRYGLAAVRLKTAALAADVFIPGLAAEEAERLRVKLTDLGQARMEGL